MATGKKGIGESAIQVSGLKLIQDSAQSPQSVKDFIASLQSSLDVVGSIGATVKSTPGNMCGEQQPGTDPRTCCKFDVSQFETFGERDGQVNFFLIVGGVAVRAEGTLKVEIPPVKTYTYADKCKPPLCKDDTLSVDVKFKVTIKLKFSVVAGSASLPDFLTFFGAGWEFSYSWSDAVSVTIACGG